MRIRVCSESPWLLSSIHSGYSIFSEQSVACSRSKFATSSRQRPSWGPVRIRSVRLGACPSIPFGLRPRQCRRVSDACCLRCASLSESPNSDRSRALPSTTMTRPRRQSEYSDRLQPDALNLLVRTNDNVDRVEGLGAADWPGDGRFAQLRTLLPVVEQTGRHSSPRDCRPSAPVGDQRAKQRFADPEKARDAWFQELGPSWELNAPLMVKYGF